VLELALYVAPATHQFSLAVDGRQADRGVPISSLTVMTRTTATGWAVEGAVPIAVLGSGALVAERGFPFTFGLWDDDLDPSRRGADAHAVAGHLDV